MLLCISAPLSRCYYAHNKTNRRKVLWPNDMAKKWKTRNETVVSLGWAIRYFTLSQRFFLGGERDPKTIQHRRDCKATQQAKLWFNLLGRKISMENFMLQISCLPCLLISHPEHWKNWSNQPGVFQFFLVEIIPGNQMTTKPLRGDFCVDLSWVSILKLHFTV